MKKHKILIVDDELLVRTNIKLLLKTCEKDILVCGEAANGKEALAAIPKCNPDVILCDMKMPEMDGLTLCKMVRTQYPEITFIALSNYDDYDYVRGTLKNGGIDYLLKHELNADSLCAVITHIPVKEQKQTSPQLNENSLNTLKENFVCNLLSGMITSEEEIIRSSELLGISICYDSVIPVVLSVDNYDRVFKTDSLKRKSIMEFSIVNIGNEILRNYGNGILTHVSDGCYCILLSFPGVNSTAKLNQSVYNLLKLLSSNLKTYLNLSTSYSIGRLCHSAKEIISSYESARETLKYTFYSGNSSILHFKKTIPETSSFTGLELAVEKKLLALSDHGDYDAVLVILDSIFSKISGEKLDLQSAQMIFTDLISIIVRTAKKNNLSLDAIFCHMPKPAELLSQSTTLEQVEKWFHKSFASICQNVVSPISVNSEYVKKAIAILKRDYALPISQASVAEEIGISSGYLSTMFKSEIGTGFNEYLTELRISMATHMLEASETDLHIIALQCGFQDYSYFFKVFKKKTGVTPSEFMKRL